LTSACPFYFCPIALLFFFLFAEQPHIKAAATAYQQGHSALLQNRPAAAVKLLTRAIEIEQTFIDAYKCLIEAHLVARDRLSAAAALTRLLEIEPHAIQYRLQLAQILLAEHQPERSLARCLLALCMMILQIGLFRPSQLVVRPPS
jgi:hypothetical protein